VQAIQAITTPSAVHDSLWFTMQSMPVESWGRELGTWTAFRGGVREGVFWWLFMAFFHFEYFLR
jgi:hypothetical protein